MADSIEVSAVIPASAERIYKAWLSSDGHGAITGGSTAKVDGKVGGEFTAWDGYISGKTLEVEKNRRIVQSWRTTDFPPGSHNSRLEVRLEEANGGTKVTLAHTNIPAGQGPEYEQGWKDFYFKPMKKYFKPKRKTVTRG